MTECDSKPRVAKQLSCCLTSLLGISQLVSVDGKFYQELEGRSSVENKPLTSDALALSYLSCSQHGTFR